MTGMMLGGDEWGKQLLGLNTAAERKGGDYHFCLAMGMRSEILRLGFSDSGPGKPRTVAALAPLTAFSLVVARRCLRLIPLVVDADGVGESCHVPLDT